MISGGDVSLGPPAKIFTLTYWYYVSVPLVLNYLLRRRTSWFQLAQMSPRVYRWTKSGCIVMTLHHGFRDYASSYAPLRH
jgi:hypothetical protein